jgi:hypothetical protein
MAGGAFPGVPLEYDPMVRPVSCLSLLCLVAAATPAQVFLAEAFNDNSAGWTLGPEWGIGPAMASSGHQYGGPDPSWDADGKLGGGVAGVVIGGNAQASLGLHGFYYLESPAIDCVGATNLVFRYDRWLNSDYLPNMENRIDVWNGTTWVNLWSTGGAPGVTDSAWTHHSFNIGAHANAALKIRFGFDVAGLNVVIVSSWNVDNVRISNGEYFFDRFSQSGTGWTTGLEWAIGDAMAGGSGGAYPCLNPGDPGWDADGTPAGGLAGAVIGGTVSTAVHPHYWLTSPTVNTAGASSLTLQFSRWLGVPGVPGSTADARIEVRDAGGNWVLVFQASSCLPAGPWSTHTYDISNQAGPAMQVRFGHEVFATGGVPSCGWNVDNISVHDPLVCKLEMSAYAGPGSVRIRGHCLSQTMPPGTKLFNCVTLSSAGFPDGYFFGISPNFVGELLSQWNTQALPFVGLTDAAGNTTWDLPAGVPPSIHVYGVTVALTPFGVIIGNSAPVHFVTM